MNVSRTIIDNWMLELVSNLFRREIRYRGRIRRASFDEVIWSAGYVENGRYRSSKYLTLNTANEELIALFELLDLLVVNDELIYDVRWSSSWRRSLALTSVSPLLKSITLSSRITAELHNKEVLLFIPGSERYYYEPLISEGSLYYLNLARLLGLYYWPSPYRARYLQEFSSRVGLGFIRNLNKYVDNNLKEIAEQVSVPLSSAASTWRFPGFGSTVLANCDTRESIFPTVMQLRESRECTAFRVWLREMDVALERGDIQTISQEIRELEGVLEDVLQGLGIKNKESEKIELQIGLSPSITMTVGLVEAIVEHFKPKPLHIVFFRNHLSRVLSNANLMSHARRLFPKLSKEIDLQN